LSKRNTRARCSPKRGGDALFGESRKVKGKENFSQGERYKKEKRDLFRNCFPKKRSYASRKKGKGTRVVASLRFGGSLKKGGSAKQNVEGREALFVHTREGSMSKIPRKTDRRKRKSAARYLTCLDSKETPSSPDCMKEVEKKGARKDARW